MGHIFKRPQYDDGSAITFLAMIIIWGINAIFSMVNEECVSGSLL